MIVGISTSIMAMKEKAKNWRKNGTKENYPTEKMESVLACIGATIMPQQPTNLLEEIICDADLYHLSLDEYFPIGFNNNVSI